MGLFDLFKNKSNSNEPTFDKFEPFQSLQKQDFAFRPTRYETWKGGKMVDSGKVNTVINAKVISVDGDEKMEVTFNDTKLNTELANKNVYDEFVTATDRLQLITIPNETNSENMGIQMFRMTIGATRHRKNFNSNEPYCCNLFLQSGKIAKVTFSYSSPEKLIEFYSERNEEDDETFDVEDLEFVFHSSDHLRYENGRHVSGPHGGAPRAVKVEPNISGNEGYTVTMFNTDGGQAVVQMAPKQMKLVKADSKKIELKGYGYDQMGSSFADYGLTIFHNDGKIEKCVLHMYDRGVDIEYLKLEEQTNKKNNTTETDSIEEINSFLNRFKTLPITVKTQLAQQTDQLNNLGVDCYENDDIENAIDYYNRALEIYPINDDALKNLIVCYREIGDFKKMQLAQTKLDYLKKIGL